MKNYYLAHPFDTRNKMREWELLVEKKYKVNIINPFYDVPRKDVTDFDKKKKVRFNFTKKHAKYIVETDLKKIKNSSGIIAIIASKSFAATTLWQKLIGHVFKDMVFMIGTIMEIAYAKTYKKPIYIVCDPTIQHHPWIQVHATKVFSTLSELCEYLFELKRE